MSYLPLSTVLPKPVDSFSEFPDLSGIVGVGAVLSKRLQKENKIHECAFFSRKSPAERNYDVGNQELLAVNGEICSRRLDYNS